MVSSKQSRTKGETKDQALNLAIILVGRRTDDLIRHMLLLVMALHIQSSFLLQYQYTNQVSLVYSRHYSFRLRINWIYVVLGTTTWREKTLTYRKQVCAQSNPYQQMRNFLNALRNGSYRQ